jgi:lipopolysaccharide transport system permease protein
MMLLKTLWRYRSLVVGTVKRDMQAQFKGSLLGTFWLVLNPLALITIYTLIFSHVMKARLPGVDDSLSYSIYLVAGITTWLYFAEVITRCTGLLVDNGNLLKKSVFPRIVLPLTVVIGSSINFIILLTIFLIVLAFLGRLPGYSLFAFIPLIFIQLTLSAGLGILLGTLNVFFRDIAQLVNIVLQFWFWLTPIVYPISILPEFARDLIFSLNPLAPLIDAYQGILLSNQWPDFYSLYPQFLIGVTFFIVGYAVFKRLAPDMADEL